MCRERFILDLGVVKCDHGEELSIALYHHWQHHHTILLKPSIFLYIKDNMLFMKVLFLIIFITNITGCEGRGFQLGGRGDALLRKAIRNYIRHALYNGTMMQRGEVC